MDCDPSGNAGSPCRLKERRQVFGFVLHGDARCRALLRGVKSAVAKTLLSLQDLRYRALAEIRKQPGCSSVQGIAINRVSDQRAENNWSLCVLSAGAADANTAARAELYVQSVLRRDYDLMMD